MGAEHPAFAWCRCGHTQRRHEDESGPCEAGACGCTAYRKKESLAPREATGTAAEPKTEPWLEPTIAPDVEPTKQHAYNFASDFPTEYAGAAAELIDRQLAGELFEAGQIVTADGRPWQIRAADGETLAIVPSPFEDFDPEALYCPETTGTCERGCEHGGDCEAERARERDIARAAVEADRERANGEPPLYVANFIDRVRALVEARDSGDRKIVAEGLELEARLDALFVAVAADRAFAEAAAAERAAEKTLEAARERRAEAYRARAAIAAVKPARRRAKT